MSEIYLRQAQFADRQAIMDIINQAKKAMKAAGSPQWQDGHPNEEMITQDIEKKEGWVLIIGGQVAGYSALIFAPEPTYKVIKEGQWASDQPYATIHRVSISDRFRGRHLSKFLFSNLITVGLVHGVANFRLDTHRVNKPMQGLAKSFNFKQRGIITVEDKIDPVRLAFELNLGNNHKVHRVNNDFMAPLLHKD